MLCWRVLGRYPCNFLYNNQCQVQYVRMFLWYVYSDQLSAQIGYMIWWPCCYSLVVTSLQKSHGNDCGSCGIWTALAAAHTRGWSLSTWRSWRAFHGTVSESTVFVQLLLFLSSIRSEIISKVEQCTIEHCMALASTGFCCYQHQCCFSELEILGMNIIE